MRGLRWLGEQLAAPTLTEQRIANCERARSMAHDPDVRIIWEGKARQLRDKRMKEAN
jgi:hypothetical protein